MLIFHFKILNVYRNIFSLWSIIKSKMLIELISVHVSFGWLSKHHYDECGLHLDTNLTLSDIDMNVFSLSLLNLLKHWQSININSYQIHQVRLKTGVDPALEGGPRHGVRLCKLIKFNGEGLDFRLLPASLVETHK